MSGSSSGGYGYGLAIFWRRRSILKKWFSHVAECFWSYRQWWHLFWADPVHEVLGVYLSVSPRLERGFHISNSDLFQNAVHAAILTETWLG